jgi:hypothetical protein
VSFHLIVFFIYFSYSIFKIPFSLSSFKNRN